MPLPERPPGPTQNVVRRYFANRAKFLDQMRRQYGPVVFFKVGFFNIYLVTDPEDVKALLVDRSTKKTWMTKLLLGPVIGNGLLLSEGEFYKRQRRLIQPAFHKKRLEIYGRVAVAAAQAWNERLRADSVVEMEKEMMELTLEVVGRSLFGSEMGPQARQIARSLDAFYGLVDWVVTLGPLAFLLPRPKTLKFLWHLFRLRAFVTGIIERRKAEGNRDDLLSMLIDSEIEGQGMSLAQVRSEALTLLLAGHETTAVMMTWTWYLLSQSPECEKRLHLELEEVLGERPPTVEDLPKLDYTRRVLSESLRLFPPAYLIDRNPSRAIHLGGYLVPKGSFVFVSPYATQRDPRFFPDPLTFDPDRWLPELVAQRPSHSFFPFGVGHRACIGQSFAWTEATLILATLARHWRFGLEPGQKIDTDPKITLRPRYGMRMRVLRR